MKYSPRKNSSYWLIGWIALFFTGMLVFFSFMMGYEITPKGSVINGQYIVSSQNNSVFIDSEFVKQQEDALSLALGEYEFCFFRYFYKTQCFTKEIRSNNYPVLMMKDVSIFPRKFRVDTITSEEVFFDSQKRGLAWYDSQKKVVFIVDTESFDFMSQSVSEDFSGIFLSQKDNELYFSSFFLDENNKNQEKDPKERETEKPQINESPKEIIAEVPQETPSSSIGESTVEIYEKDGVKMKKDVRVHFQPSPALLSNIDTLFARETSQKITPLLHSFLIKNDEGQDELLATFDTPAKEIIPLKKGYLIHFPYSVWVFDFYAQSFQKVVSIDEGSDIFFHKSSESLFYIRDKTLMRIFF